MTTGSGVSIWGNGGYMHCHTTEGGNANRDLIFKYTNNELFRGEPLSGNLNDQYSTNPLFFGDLSGANVGLSASIGLAQWTNFIIKY